MPNDERAKQEQVENAKQHMEKIAKGFVAVLGPEYATTLIAGALIMILMDMKGQEGAALYLRTLCDEVARDGIPPEASN